MNFQYEIVLHEKTTKMKLDASSMRSLEFESSLTRTKQLFEDGLKNRLNLEKVNAPLFVPTKTGLNDDLSGVERPVSFQNNGETYEVVHSLAKWKRWYLGVLSAQPGQGIVADMRAIRADEHLSPIHSNLVDQWDWEKVIPSQDRTVETLIQHGKMVYETLKTTEIEIAKKRKFSPSLPKILYVIHAEELLQKYPELSSKDREHEIAKKHGAVLIIGIGASLSNGEVHDLRAPDYDDWSTLNEDGLPGLNADLIVWDDTRKASLELSSMGIRVDEEALKKQLKISNSEGRLEQPFHRSLIAGKLPTTIGGGIGQSRVAMFIHKHSDIKEVQPIFNEQY